MRALLLTALCLTAVACSDLKMEPGTKSAARRDVPPGAGLLTGPKGEFVIFRVEESRPAAAGAAETTPPADNGADQ